MEILLMFCLDLFVTAIAYLLVPTIFCFCRKRFTLSRIGLIVGINGACVWLIFMIIRINQGIDGTSSAVFLWSAVAFFLMKKYCFKNPDDNKPIEESKPVKKYVVTKVKKINSANIQAQKQKQKKNKRLLIFVAITTSILLIVNVTCNIIQYVKNQELVKQIEEQENVTFSEWSNAKKAAEKAEFLDENIVFVIDGYGDYFYTYDEMMSVIEGKGDFTYWAYNKEQAIGLGYIAAYRN